MLTFKQEINALAKAIETARDEAAAAEAQRADMPKPSEAKKQRAALLQARIDAIVDYLGDRPANRPWAITADIANGTGLTFRIVTQTLIKLRKANTVKAKPHGKFALQWSLA